LANLIHVAVQTKNQLVVINPQTDKITARYDLKKGNHPHGFYIDAPRNRAYISCQEDNKLIVFNLGSHQEEDVFQVEPDPDVLAFDSELNLLYVACESGGVSIFKADGGKLTKLGDADVGPNSHTVAVDSKTHKAYFPLRNLNGAPVLRIMAPSQNVPEALSHAGSNSPSSWREGWGTVDVVSGVAEDFVAAALSWD
jgi:DNA-binding beta-propeller fold protein YncE